LYQPYGVNWRPIRGAFVRLGAVWTGITEVSQFSQENLVRAQRDFKLVFDDSMRHPINISALIDRHLDRKRFIIEERHASILHLWYGTFLYSFPDYGDDNYDIRFFTHDVKTYDSLSIYINVKEDRPPHIAMTHNRLISSLGSTPYELYTKQFQTGKALCDELDDLCSRLKLNPNEFPQLIQQSNYHAGASLPGNDSSDAS
jgi:hypothetical protein